MTLTMELVRFTVAAGHEELFISPREAALADLRTLPGLLSATLARGQDGVWVDVLVWQSLPEALAADEAVRGGGLPATAAWASLIEDVVGMTHAEVVHRADGLAR